jgi:hypothetical protein
MMRLDVIRDAGGDDEAFRQHIAHSGSRCS